MQLYTYLRLSNQTVSSCVLYLNDEYVSLDYDENCFESYVDACDNIKKYHINKITINSIGMPEIILSNMRDNNLNKTEVIYMKDMLYKFDASICVVSNIQILRNRKQIEAIEYDYKNKTFIIR